VVPQAQQATDQTSLLARRKTVNSNASQLHELLAWDKKGSASSTTNYKSQERQATFGSASRQSFPQENHFSPKQVEAAGMKSKFDTSPFAPTVENQQRQLSQLQSNLSQMQIDKERVSDPPVICSG